MFGYLKKYKKVFAKPATVLRLHSLYLLIELKLLSYLAQQSEIEICIGTSKAPYKLMHV